MSPIFSYFYKGNYSIFVLQVKYRMRDQRSVNICLQPITGQRSHTMRLIYLVEALYNAIESNLHVCYQ